MSGVAKYAKRRTNCMLVRSYQSSTIPILHEAPLQSCSITPSLSVRDQVSHLYRTIGKTNEPLGLYTDVNFVDGRMSL
jgi:hypothetical protein